MSVLEKVMAVSFFAFGFVSFDLGDNDRLFAFVSWVDGKFGAD